MKYSTDHLFDDDLVRHWNVILVKCQHPAVLVERQQTCSLQFVFWQVIALKFVNHLHRRVLLWMLLGHLGINPHIKPFQVDFHFLGY